MWVKNSARGLFRQKIEKSQHYGFSYFWRFVWIKKNEMSLEKMVNFAQNTNFDIFPQKLNMKAHFPNFSDFLHVWCVFYNIWKLVILKVILCLGYSKVGVMNSHLKSGENWPKHKFWYFLSKTIYESTFSPFFIFLHIRVVSQNTLCMSIEITVFLNPHKSSKIGKSAMLYFREFWVK